MPSTALFIHVPVDRIEIVSARVTDGKLFHFMSLIDPNKQLSIAVTLRTRASEKLFQRKLVLTSASVTWVRSPNGRLSHLTFKGSFASQDVRGFCVIKNDKVLTGEFIAA